MESSKRTALLVALCMMLLVGSFALAACSGPAANSETTMREDASQALEGSTASEANEGADDAELRLIAHARDALGVPNDRGIVCSLGKEYYWEGGGQHLRSVSFLEDGELCAGADCNEDGVPIRNIVPY